MTVLEMPRVKLLVEDRRLVKHGYLSAGKAIAGFSSVLYLL